jgi:hypothetical protein
MVPQYGADCSFGSDLAFVSLFRGYVLTLNLIDLRCPSASAEFPAALTGRSGNAPSVWHSPTIVVDGSAADDLDTQPQANNENLIILLENLLQKCEEDRQRTAYA